MRDKIASASSFVVVLLRRFFLGWYEVEQKLDRLERENEDIRAELVKVSASISSILLIIERLESRVSLRDVPPILSHPVLDAQ